MEMLLSAARCHILPRLISAGSFRHARSILLRHCYRRRQYAAVNPSVSSSREREKNSMARRTVFKVYWPAAVVVALLASQARVAAQTMGELIAGAKRNLNWHLSRVPRPSGAGKPSPNSRLSSTKNSASMRGSTIRRDRACRRWPRGSSRKPKPAENHPPMSTWVHRRPMRSSITEGCWSESTIREYFPG